MESLFEKYCVLWLKLYRKISEKKSDAEKTIGIFGNFTKSSKIGIWENLSEPYIESAKVYCKGGQKTFKNVRHN